MKLTDAPASAEDWSTAGPPDRTAVQIRPVRRITAALWAATLLAALAVLALTLITWGDLKLSDGISSLYIPVAAVAYATLGVLIIRRAANLIGWIMLAEGIGLAFVGLASAYAITGVAAYPSRSRRQSWPARCPSAAFPPWSSSRQRLRDCFYGDADPAVADAAIALLTRTHPRSPPTAGALSPGPTWCARRASHVPPPGT